MDNDPKAVVDAVYQLSNSDLPSDWRTKWQDVSEAIWAALAAEEPEIPSPTIDLYIDLLQDHSRFALARAVLPALREPQQCTPHQQRILDGSDAVRGSMADLASRRQHYYDEQHFVEEKHTLQTSMLHRFGVLLHSSEPFGSVQHDALRTWLQNAPTTPRMSDAANDSTGQRSEKRQEDARG